MTFYIYTTKWLETLYHRATDLYRRMIQYETLLLFPRMLFFSADRCV